MDDTVVIFPFFFYTDHMAFQQKGAFFFPKAEKPFLFIILRQQRMNDCVTVHLDTPHLTGC